MKSISLSKLPLDEMGDVGKEPPGRTIILALTGKEFSLPSSCCFHWSDSFRLSSRILQQMEIEPCLSDDSNE